MGAAVFFALAPLAQADQALRIRDLLLRALGTREPARGEVRIPVPVERDSYEVIIAAPREPAFVPLTSKTPR